LEEPVGADVISPNLARIGLIHAARKSIFTSLSNSKKQKIIIMKFSIKQPFNGLTKSELDNLTREIKETICYEKVSSPIKNTFTSAELARIQGLKRRIVIRKGFNL